MEEGAELGWMERTGVWEYVVVWVMACWYSVTKSPRRCFFGMMMFCDLIL